MGRQNEEIVYLGLQERLCRAISIEMAVRVGMKGMERWDKEYVCQIADEIYSYIWWENKGGK